MHSLTDVAMARTRQGGHYASVVQIDGIGTAHVASEPRATATGLVKQFYEWVGGDATSRVAFEHATRRPGGRLSTSPTSDS